MVGRFSDLGISKKERKEAEINEKLYIWDIILGIKMT
jgi:hypothetical protein